MASNTQTWSTWSLATKLTVGIGMFLAAALVAALYLPH
jgi:hypothetical protein